MSRKHYVAMAEALRFARPSPAPAEALSAERLQAKYSQRQWQADVEGVADVFAQDNGNFNRSRFYAAAGLDR